MIKYTARFEGYDFKGNTKKIIFKNIKNNNIILADEAYMDALRVPYLIGNLVMGEKVNFIARIENDKITNPMRIDY